MSGWIAADWGTSRLRIWALTGEGEVTHSLASDDGMGRLSPAEFEPAFLRLAAPLLPPAGAAPVPVLICGMAGARSGWQEVSYAAVPCAPLAPPERVRGTDPRISLRILPGLCQSDPPDVMRGEETQIAGFLAADPGFDGVICLPGTHTKWVRVAKGRVTAFRTAMTGELFDLLTTRSTLAGLAGGGWDEAGFRGGLALGMTGGGDGTPALAADLFGIRAAALLSPPVPGEARARLSGLLIGAEVAGMRDVWRDRPVALIGDPALSALYRQALDAAGGAARLFAAETLTLNGLRAAEQRYPEDRP